MWFMAIYDLTDETLIIFLISFGAWDMLKHPASRTHKKRWIIQLIFYLKIAPNNQSSIPKCSNGAT